MREACIRRFPWGCPLMSMTPTPTLAVREASTERARTVFGLKRIWDTAILAAQCAPPGREIAAGSIQRLYPNDSIDQLTASLCSIAFSSEVDTGSREETRQNKERDPVQFNRNGRLRAPGGSAGARHRIDGGAPSFPVSRRLRQSLVAERDSSFHSLPCFCQFIRMARFCGVFLPSLNSCSPTKVKRTIAAGPTTLTVGFLYSSVVHL